MNRALWIARRNELCSLIKQVSDAYGGDDPKWLKEYAKELIERESGYFSEAISCFTDLVKGLPKKPHHEPVWKPETTCCPNCGYVPPFCYYFKTKDCSTIERNVP